jgi:hypothetical protein
MQLFEPTEFARNPNYRSTNVSRLVPIATVRDGAYVLTDGSLSAVFRVTGPLYELETNQNLGSFVERLQGMLNSMPNGMTMRVLHRIHHNWRDMLDHHTELMNGKNHFARYVMWTRERELRAEMEAGHLLRNENLIVLNYNPSRNWWHSRDKADLIKEFIQSILSPGQITQRTERRYRQVIDEFEAIVRPIQLAMESARMRPERLEDRELYELAWQVLNPMMSLRKPCPIIRKPTMGDPYVGTFANMSSRAPAGNRRPSHGMARVAALAPITEREQLCQTSLRTDLGYMKLGKRYLGVLTMRLLPTHTYRTMGLKLCEIGFPCTISFEATMLAKASELKKAMNTANLSEAAAGIKLFKDAKDDPAAVAMAREREERMIKMLGAHQHPFTVRLVVVVEAGSQRELDQRCDSVMSLAREMDAMELAREEYGLEDIIRATWPFGLPSDFGARKILTSELAALLPLFDRWKGSERPLTIFADRMDRLVGHDSFPLKSESKNTLICGRTGTGKSVAGQLLKIQPFLARENTEAIIIESGESFKYTTEAFGGYHIRIGPSCPYTFNAFDLPESFAEMSEAEKNEVLELKIRFLQQWIFTMLRMRDPEQMLLANSILGECAQATYAAHPTPLLRHFHAILTNYRHPSLQQATDLAAKIALQLKPYINDGAYARYTDRETQFDVNNKIITFDLADIKDEELLMEPMATLITAGVVGNRLRRKDGKERMIVLDEAWALIKPREDGSTSTFGKAIETLWRECRKLGAQAILITQNLSDVFQDTYGRAVLSNSRHLLILAHNRSPDNDKAFQSQNFSRELSDSIYGLQQRRGEYSELLIREDDNMGVVRVPAPGLSYWMTSTHPPDKEVRNRYIQRYVEQWKFPLEGVLVLLAENFPAGVEQPHPPEMSEEEAVRYLERWRDHYRRFCALVESGAPIPEDFS